MTSLKSVIVYSLQLLFLVSLSACGNSGGSGGIPAMHTITASALENGSIDPAGALWVNDGESKSFTITPDAGYHIKSVDGTCGGSLLGTIYTSNPVTMDCTILAGFEIDGPSSTHTITASALENGSIDPAGALTVNDGESKSFTITPNAGYHIKSVDGTCGGSLLGTIYTVNPITTDCTIWAGFEMDGPGIVPFNPIGLWGTNLLYSGSTNWWQQGALTVYENDAIVHSTLDSSGTLAAASGSISTSETGTITLTTSGSINLNVDSQGTVMHGIASSNSGVSLLTALKKTDSYSTNDLEGVWKVNILVSGWSSPWWERGSLTISSSGTFTASTLDMYGSPGYLSAGGSLALSADGVLTMPAHHPTLNGVMDSDKSVIIWTATWPDRTTELGVLTKQAASYSETDLVGTWKFSTISTGMSSSVSRGAMTVSSNGSAVSEFVRADGSTGSYEIDLSIAADGTVTIQGSPAAKGFIDSGKTVMIFTEITANVPHSAITILTKQ